MITRRGRREWLSRAGHGVESAFGAMRRFVWASGDAQPGAVVVAALYAVLWIGGTAWHSLTCSHHSCTVCEVPADVSTNHCGYHHHGTEDSPKPPASPLHDSEDCPVCQWFGQAQSPSTVVTHSVTQQLVTIARRHPNQTPLTPIPRDCLARAPPAAGEAT